MNVHEFFNENPESYSILLSAFSKYQLDPIPTGREILPDDQKQAATFLRYLWSQYTKIEGHKEQLAWLDEEIPQYYLSFSERPNWIQGFSWPFAGGWPMIFVGQLDVKVEPDNLASRYYHDDISYYIFIPRYDLITLGEWHPKRVITQHW